MPTTALIEPPSSADVPGAHRRASHLSDSYESLAGLPPLLGIVPQAGPPLFAYVGFGVVLLLLLVPPFALLATLMGVALVVVAALVALAVVAGAILEAPFLLVRLLRGRLLGHFSQPVLHIRRLRARRV